MSIFKELGIKPTVKGFVGDKIKISKVLNKKIRIFHWKEGPSNYQDKGSGRRLDMQIELEGEKRIAWTGSTYLMDMIKKVPVERFPIDTTIVEVDGHLEFL